MASNIHSFLLCQKSVTPDIHCILLHYLRHVYHFVMWVESLLLFPCKCITCHINNVFFPSFPSLTSNCHCCAGIPPVTYVPVCHPTMLWWKQVSEWWLYRPFYKWDWFVFFLQVLRLRIDYRNWSGNQYLLGLYF